MKTNAKTLFCLAFYFIYRMAGLYIYPSPSEFYAEKTRDCRQGQNDQWRQISAAIEWQEY
jgi:hypothetical protein